MRQQSRRRRRLASPRELRQTAVTYAAQEAALLPIAGASTTWVPQSHPADHGAERADHPLQGSLLRLPPLGQYSAALAARCLSVPPGCDSSATHTKASAPGGVWRSPPQQQQRPRPPPCRPKRMSQVLRHPRSPRRSEGAEIDCATRWAMGPGRPWRCAAFMRKVASPSGVVMRPARTLGKTCCRSWRARWR